jgi:hypothetical protein
MSVFSNDAAFMGVRKARIADVDGLAFVVLIASHNRSFFTAKVTFLAEEAGK